jgi:hypothetical protein
LSRAGNAWGSKGNIDRTAFEILVSAWKELCKETEEVRQAISELSRELSTNEIALFSIVLSAEFGQKNLHSAENKSEKNINTKIFLQNFKCSSTTAKDLVISAKICEVNVIFNVILMFEVSRLPATC